MLQKYRIFPTYTNVYLKEKAVHEEESDGGRHIPTRITRKPARATAGATPMRRTLKISGENTRLSALSGPAISRKPVTIRTQPKPIQP